MSSDQPQDSPRITRAAPAFTPSAELDAVLREAQTRKFIGATVSLAAHVANGTAFASIVTDTVADVGAAPGAASQDDRAGSATAVHGVHIVDLGSGGGIPALVIGEVLTTARLTLVERGSNRAAFLQQAIRDLGWAQRVEVICSDAESAARRPELEGSADVVTARSFAPPAVTAECAARFLRQGGRVIVSEPPASEDAPSRWPAEGLALTGCRPGATVAIGTHSFQILHRDSAVPDRIPRRDAVTRKRPLF